VQALDGTPSTCRLSTPIARRAELLHRADALDDVPLDVVQAPDDVRRGTTAYQEKILLYTSS
jgi:hypothetical protein